VRKESAVGRPRTQIEKREEHFYFISYVTSGEGAPQRIENGVIGYPKEIDCLSDIRRLETIIKERSTAITAGGGQIIGDAGIQIRVIDYKRIRRE
jgi:hypothetical protein